MLKGLEKAAKVTLRGVNEQGTNDVDYELINLRGGTCDNNRTEFELTTIIPTDYAC